MGGKSGMLSRRGDLRSGFCGLIGVCQVEKLEQSCPLWPYYRLSSPASCFKHPVHSLTHSSEELSLTELMPTVPTVPKLACFTLWRAGSPVEIRRIIWAALAGGGRDGGRSCILGFKLIDTVSDQLAGKKNKVKYSKTQQLGTVSLSVRLHA